MEKVQRDLFRCPICFEIPEIAIYQCKNGHTICDTCSKDLELCPQCREPYEQEKIRNRALEELIAGTQISCKYKESGCKEEPLRKNLVAHLETCEFRPLNICKLVGFPECSFDSPKSNEIFRHLCKDHGLIPMVGKVKMDATLQKQLEYMRTTKENRIFRVPVELNPVPSVKSQYLICCHINFDQGDFSVFSMYFGHKSTNVSPYIVTIEINAAHKNHWKWSGKPMYYKNVEYLKNNPPLKIPIKYLLDMASGANEEEFSFKIAFSEEWSFKF